MENAAAAPTGCYKCGRPGHWSRDCPSSASASASAPIPNSESTRPSSSFKTTGTGVAKSTEKPKKAPRTRPKLTPELILSDDGLGYVLRHFPRSFKFRGHGHEVSDLGNLIGLYSEWHSRLLPYYSFDQFVHKAEQVAATKRVKMCLRELRERVAKGGDPTKLHDPLVHDDSNVEQVPAEAMNSEAPSHHQGDPSSRNNDADDILDMFHDIHETATESLHCEEVAADTNQVPNNGTTQISEIQITEEQKTRMESSRLKALERAAARARSLQAP
ncbi:uncharacterized protein LOC126717888 isoform X1 [Quercus robur]|uniref:uncharacterized protein LOC126717888 isoform X1 n=1 Tax=Quercus robur TaxID=38942 RepID=UPI002162B9C1|nr:uncharacterized protein LOC126717888 isoform X1 [Quercus robur]